MLKRNISKYLSPVFETKTEAAEWFGYYNYSPLNSDNSKMLCNKANTERSPRKGDVIELGYYDIPSGDWHHIGKTDSWNWQQGAMMQWLPSSDGKEHQVIYNCSRDNHIISKIFDIDTQETRELDWGIYGITPDGKKSISLDLERSYYCRAYHYQSVANPAKEGRIVDGDGIYEIDLENNTRRLLIDIKTIVSLQPDSDFDKKKHWVEHIMINPSGTRFCFLHRFSPVDNVRQYQTRIFIANIDGSHLQVIPGWDTFSWSHFGWNGDNGFSIYTYKKPSLYKKFGTPSTPASSNKKKVTFKQRLRKFALNIKKRIPKSLLRRALTNNSYYQYYSLNAEGVFELSGSWKQLYFNIDGHPSFSSNQKYMLTDSYADDKGFRRYVIYNLQTQKGMIVAKMPENHQDRHVPCDLHPKLSKDNQFVMFDTTSQGKHSLLLLKLNWQEIESKLS